MPPPQLYPAEFRAALIPPARKRRKNPRTVTMPDHVGPHVKLVFAEMARQRMTYDSLEERSGVRRATTKAWRRKNRPGLESLEAALATLGFGLVPVAALEALPAELAGELTALALKLRMNIPLTWAALIGIGVEQKLLRMRADERAAVLADHDTRRLRHDNDNTPHRRTSGVAASAT
jgi:transcriptional regulator with XRE-family HTH domain